MQQIPLQAVPSQSVNVQLGNQACSINIYQQTYGLYCDVFVSGVLLVSGVICLNLSRIVRSLYFGFQGDLIFVDTQGTSDPVYTGLAGRFAFIYLAPSDLPAGVG